MLDYEEQRSQLQNLQSEAKRKARNARQVINTEGYQEYLEWIDRYCRVNKPEIRDVNSFIAFIANSLINAGVRFGSTYFNAIQQDAIEIEKQLEEYTQFSATHSKEE